MHLPFFCALAGWMREGGLYLPYSNGSLNYKHDFVISHGEN